MNETVARRALTGVTFVDAFTGAAIVDPLTVTLPGVTLRPNRSGVYTIFATPAFVAAASASGAFEITVVDASARYLPRRATIATPAGGAAPVPARITLYPSAAREVAPNWAAVRASVASAAPPNAPLAWATVDVARTSDNTVLASGLADARGEALVAIPGVSRRPATNGNGTAADASVAVTVTASFDRAVRGQPAGWIPDPSTLRAPPDPAVATVSAPLTLRSGAVAFAQLRIPA